MCNQISRRGEKHSCPAKETTWSRAEAGLVWRLLSHASDIFAWCNCSPIFRTLRPLACERVSPGKKKRPRIVIVDGQTDTHSNLETRRNNVTLRKNLSLRQVRSFRHFGTPNAMHFHDSRFHERSSLLRDLRFHTELVLRNASLDRKCKLYFATFVRFPRIGIFRFLFRCC